jgi:hypothetical protein
MERDTILFPQVSKRYSKFQGYQPLLIGRLLYPRNRFYTIFRTHIIAQYTFRTSQLTVLLSCCKVCIDVDWHLNIRVT